MENNLISKFNNALDTEGDVIAQRNNTLCVEEVVHLYVNKGELQSMDKSSFDLFSTLLSDKVRSLLNPICARVDVKLSNAFLDHNMASVLTVDWLDKADEIFKAVPFHITRAGEGKFILTPEEASLQIDHLQFADSVKYGRILKRLNKDKTIHFKFYKTETGLRIVASCPLKSLISDIKDNADQSMADNKRPQVRKHAEL